MVSLGHRGKGMGGWAWSIGLGTTTYPFPHAHPPTLTPLLFLLNGQFLQMLILAQVGQHNPFSSLYAPFDFDKVEV